MASTDRGRISVCMKYDEPFTEDDLRDLYVMIYKKQEGKLDKYGTELLRKELLRYLCFAANLFENWLSVHGVFGYEDFLNAFFSRYGGGGLLVANLRNLPENVVYDAYEDEPGDFMDYTNTLEVYSLPNWEGTLYLTLSELLRDGSRDLYERYKEYVGNSEEAREVLKAYKKVVQAIRGPATLSELIITADMATHVQHLYGNILEDYGGIDVEEAKKEAEEVIKSL